MDILDIWNHLAKHQQEQEQLTAAMHSHAHSEHTLQHMGPHEFARLKQHCQQLTWEGPTQETDQHIIQQTPWTPQAATSTIVHKHLQDYYYLHLNPIFNPQPTTRYNGHTPNTPTHKSHHKYFKPTVTWDLICPHSNWQPAVPYTLNFRTTQSTNIEVHMPLTCQNCNELISYPPNINYTHITQVRYNLCTHCQTHPTQKTVNITNKLIRQHQQIPDSNLQKTVWTHPDFDKLHHWHHKSIKHYKQQWKNTHPAVKHIVSPQYTPTTNTPAPSPHDTQLTVNHTVHPQYTPTTDTPTHRTNRAQSQATYNRAPLTAYTPDQCKRTYYHTHWQSPTPLTPKAAQYQQPVITQQKQPAQYQQPAKAQQKQQQKCDPLNHSDPRTIQVCTHCQQTEAPTHSELCALAPPPAHKHHFLPATHRCTHCYLPVLSAGNYPRCHRNHSGKHNYQPPTPFSTGQGAAPHQQIPPEDMHCAHCHQPQTQTNSNKQCKNNATQNKGQHHLIPTTHSCTHCLMPILPYPRQTNKCNRNQQQPHNYQIPRMALPPEQPNRDSRETGTTEQQPPSGTTSSPNTHIGVESTHTTPQQKHNKQKTTVDKYEDTPPLIRHKTLRTKQAEHTPYLYHTPTKVLPATDQHKSPHPKDRIAQRSNTQTVHEAQKTQKESTSTKTNSPAHRHREQHQVKQRLPGTPPVTGVPHTSTRSSTGPLPTHSTPQQHLITRHRNILQAERSNSRSSSTPRQQPQQPTVHLATPERSHSSKQACQNHKCTPGRPPTTQYPLQQTTNWNTANPRQWPTPTKQPLTESRANTKQQAQTIKHSTQHRETEQGETNNIRATQEDKQGALRTRQSHNKYRAPSFLSRAHQTQKRVNTQHRPDNKRQLSPAAVTPTHPNRKNTKHNSPDTTNSTTTTTHPSKRSTKHSSPGAATNTPPNTGKPNSNTKTQKCTVHPDNNTSPNTVKTDNNTVAHKYPVHIDNLDRDGSWGDSRDPLSTQYKCIQCQERKQLGVHTICTKTTDKQHDYHADTEVCTKCHMTVQEFTGRLTSCTNHPPPHNSQSRYIHTHNFTATNPQQTHTATPT